MRYLILIVALCNPHWVSAKSFADGKRYICTIKSAAGWSTNGGLDQLEITEPGTQYIIEPTVQNFALPRFAKEGFEDVVASHMVKKLGDDQKSAICSATWMDDTVFCFVDTSIYEDEVQGAVFSTPRFIIYQVEENIFITKDETFSQFFVNKLDILVGRPSVEVGICDEF